MIDLATRRCSQGKSVSLSPTSTTSREEAIEGRINELFTHRSTLLISFRQDMQDTGTLHVPRLPVAKQPRLSSAVRVKGGKDKR
jgi:hypothetical protein